MSEEKAFFEHLSELRNRALACLFVFACGAVYGYLFKDIIVKLLTSPLKEPIYYNSPVGGIGIIIKICLCFGIIVAFPVICYNMVRFIQPAIRSISGVTIFYILNFSYLLMLIRMAFAYFLIIPASLNFLKEFSTPEIQALITANDYFTFIALYMVGFTLLFQLPLILLTANKIKKLSTKWLLKQERIVIVVSFILAAVLSPTVDVVNLLLMAVPMIILYQVSILVVWFANLSKKEKKQLVEVVFEPLSQ